MRGMSALTGAVLLGTAHLQQSIADILLTPLGTRVALAEYGSAVPDLIDAPMNGLNRIRLFAAAADALARWEPRIRVTAVTLAESADGTAELGIEAIDLEAPIAGAGVRLTLPLRQTA